MRHTNTGASDFRMRLFQNFGLYPAYIPRLRKLSRGCQSFSELLRAFLQDRYGACHLLKPVLENDPSAFYTNGDDRILQDAWARENGLPPRSTLQEILLAQIEDHRTEVFYNLDPMRYGSDFVRRLPGCVVKSIAWRAAPSSGVDFGAFDLLVCNFPTILETYRSLGWKASYFSPAHDPVMDDYARNKDRPIDVLFVGGYSRHHRNRAAVLEVVAALAPRFNVRYCLDRSRLTRLSEAGMGLLVPLARHRRPRAIRMVSVDPVFGRDLYSALSQSKVVLNGAVDMAGFDRGNMRCFESMGCGAAMVSDRGVYPEGMVDGVTMHLYDDPHSAQSIIEALLGDGEQTSVIAARGHASIKERYSKTQQWQSFVQLIDQV
jgi:Glycosyl transferases group 1